MAKCVAGYETNWPFKISRRGATVADKANYLFIHNSLFLANVTTHPGVSTFPKKVLAF